MKKLITLLFSTFFAFSVSASTSEAKKETYEFIEGKQYTTLKLPQTDEPEVLEFFSFYCPACYMFDQTYKISDNLKKAAAEARADYRKHHVSFMGKEVGAMLTQAWALAVAMKIEDKVTPIFFERVQEKRNISKLSDIRDVFIEVGVPAEEFDTLWDSMLVRYHLNRQTYETKAMDVRSIPAIFVNGKYMVNGLGMKDVGHFSETVKFLLNKK